MNKKEENVKAVKKTLKVEVRKIEGRKVKNLRREGIIPANIFGKKIKSLSVQVQEKDFQSLYKDVGETTVFDLEVGEETRPVLIHRIQINPKTDKILHVDFHQVDLKEKIEAEVPVELIGESPAEKQSLGTVVQYINEVKVEALPADLPEKFLVDSSNLTEVDQAIYIKDLTYDRSKVVVKNGEEEIIVKVEPPQKEEVVETAPTSVEAEVASEGGEDIEEETPTDESKSSETLEQ